MVWEGQEIRINTCQMIDWRKALGLHLWFASSPTSPLSDVMEDYGRAFQVSIESDPRLSQSESRLSQSEPRLYIIEALSRQLASLVLYACLVLVKRFVQM